MKITQAVLGTLKPGRRPYDLPDSEQRGLVLRVRPSGHHSWLVRLGRGRWYTIGRCDVIPPLKARKLAQEKLGEQAAGGDPIGAKRAAKRQAATLEQFLNEHYDEWARANLKTTDATTVRVRAIFAEFLKNPITEITTFAIERWRTKRHRDGRTPTTTNRDLNALRAVLSKAVLWKVLAAHPLRDVKAAKTDPIGRLRYLSADEEPRLRAALATRDHERRDGRARFNAWRIARGYKTVPVYGTYPDHLSPLVLLALNTGLRRGELFGLRWRDVDHVGALLTVHGASAKTGRTRYLPLNTEALDVLRSWRPNDATDDDLVFPGAKGGPLTTLKTAWAKLVRAAAIPAFRFHDLRHSFASKLVQAGVDLNTVRELLGHSDIKMTLRYAHLAPEHRAAAVAKLVHV